MRFRRLADSEIQTDGATELKKCSPKDIKLRLEMLSVLARGSEGAWCLIDFMQSEAEK